MMWSWARLRRLAISTRSRYTPMRPYPLHSRTCRVKLAWYACAGLFAGNPAPTGVESTLVFAPHTARLGASLSRGEARTGSIAARQTTTTTVFQAILLEREGGRLPRFFISGRSCLGNSTLARTEPSTICIPNIRKIPFSVLSVGLPLSLSS